MDIVDATYPPPEGDFTTNIDHDERVVTVDYDDVMPPRIAAWRPVLGCVQLPSGAKTDDIALMPSVGPDISVPNYDELDSILECLIEDDLSINEVIEKGFSEKIVSKVKDLLHLSEYKRYQACPGPKISRRPFALGRRIPVVNHWRD